MPGRVCAAVSCGPWLWYMMLSLLVRELWQGLAAEEAQHVGVDIKYRGGAGYWGPQFGERGSVIISYASFCSFKITFSPRTHQNKKEEVILSRSRDPMTVSKHHVHTSFHWTYFHRSGIRPVIPPTQMMKTHPPTKTGLDSALAPILQIKRRTASQAAVDSPLSPLHGLKPHCHGADAPEHSGHRAVISCCIGLEEVDTMWPLWSTDADVRTVWRSAEAASCVKIPGIR